MTIAELKKEAVRYQRFLDENETESRQGKVRAEIWNRHLQNTLGEIEGKREDARFRKQQRKEVSK